MKRIMLSVLVLALAAGGALAQAPVVDAGWTAFVIREGATEAPFIVDNDDYATDAIEIGTTESGQKAGLATDLINGAMISQITGLHIDRLDAVLTSGSLYGPYFNIWVTDGEGRYAVLSNEPSDGEWAEDRWYVPDWETLRTRRCKVFEVPGAVGGQPGTSWVADYTGKASDLIFDDVAGLVISPPPVAYIQDSLNAVGTGAPDELGTDIAHGYTWVFGDTAANYVTGGDGFIVDNYYATAAFAAQNLSDGSLWGVIQDAIDAAAPGNEIVVLAGVHREQLTIGKDLTLRAETPGLATIEAPDAVDRTPYGITTWTGSARTIDAIVGVTGATVHLADLIIDGRDTGPDNFYGIYYQDASGSVTGCTVDNVTYPAGPGAQRVVSMAFSQSAATGPYDVLVADNEVPIFQKGGILVMGPNVAFTVNDNEVTAYPTADIAGNGIQLSYGAHGTTSGNTVTGVGYTGEDWAGTGILLFESGDVAMDGDTVTGSQKAVDYSDWRWTYSAPAPVNLTIANLALSGNEWGFSVQLSGLNSAVNLVMSDCSITGTTGDAMDIWGTSLDPWGGSYYTGWENGTLDVTITGLTLDNTGYDGIWTADLSGSGTNTIAGFDVTGSSFTNTVGGAVANTFAETINAPENYWGDPAGPLAGLKALGEKTLAPTVSPAGVDLPKSGWTPTVPTLTAAKAAETVTGPVDFSPWYGLPLGSVPQTIGTNDSIQDAIDLALDGDTVQVAAGLYTEAVVVNKEVALLGATAGVNKNGYTVPAGYAWDPAVESILVHPDPVTGYNAIVDIYDMDNVTLDGFVVQELAAVANKNVSLVRVYALTGEASNINVVNNVIGPNTNTTLQDGAQGRMGLYIVNHPYGDQGVVDSNFAGNKIFDCQGNGDNVFLWTSYFAYGAPGPADMRGTVIQDNEIYGSHRSGIETAGGFANLTIRNNTIYGQTGLPADDPDLLKYGHGIQLIRGASDKMSDPLTAYGPVDLTIEGNEIYGNQKCGIYMGPKNTGVHLVDNVIRDNGWDGVMLDLEGNYWNPTYESPPVSGLYACYDCSEDITAAGNEIFGNGSLGNPIAQHGMQVVGVPSNGLVLAAEGNWWGADSGPLDVSDDTATGGLYNPAGLGDAVTDFIDYEPWLGLAVAAAVPASSGPLACGNYVVLTVSLTTDDYTADVFGFNAVLRKTDEVDLTAIAPLAPFGGTTQFMYFDQGDGSYLISGTTIGSPTQPITGAGTTPLFTVTLLTDGDGLAEISFDSFGLRDPLNQPIAASASGATILVDCTPPLPVTALTAAPGHNKIDVTWAHALADVDHFEVWRGLWYDGTIGSSAYPEYDDLPGDMIPTRPTGYGVFGGPVDEWVRLDLDDVTGVAYTDGWDNADDRGVYYYEIFAVDAAGNGSPPAAANDRATNYWLGDVYGTPGVATPNGEVDPYDINELGAAFGLTVPLNATWNDLDVGPTDDWSRLGIPTTDSFINFEDLMVFSMNFGVVSAAKSQAPKADRIELAWVSYDDGSRGLRLVSGDGLKGVRVTAAAAVAGVTAGELLDRQDELTFLRNLGDQLDVSVAVMGVDNGFVGSGDLFVVAPGSELTVADLTIDARGIDNAKLEFSLGESSGTLTPRVFALNANYPNPFNPMTKISFSLPESQPVKLTIYGVDGRRVATLLNETRGPGLHEVLWNGRDDSDRSVSSGLYFYRIEAGPYSQVRKMTLMK